MSDKVKDADKAKAENSSAQGNAQESKPQEVGGSDKPDPVRYGDWEINGKCIDF